MSSFCNYCGRPLPENGVCQCRMQQPQQPQYQQPQYQQPQYQQPQYQQPQYQQPQYQQPQYQQPQYQQPQYQQPQYQQPQYQQPQYPQQYQQPQAPAQPSAFGKAFSDLMPFVKSFMQNSTAAVKKVVAEKGLVFALIITGFFAVISMLSWMTASFGISLNTIGSINRFTPTIAPLLVGMFFPLIMVALAALSYFLGGKMSKKNVSFVDALTAAGSASILPAVIMAVAIILNLWFYSGVLLFCLFACAAVVVYFMNLREVFEIKGFLPMIVQIGFSAVTFAIGLFLMAESIIGAWFFF